MLTQYLILSVIIMSIGATGVLVRRNFLTIIMSVELMINGAGMLLVIMSYYIGNISGQVMYIFVAAIAASETAIGLAISIVMYRKKRSIDINDFASLKK